MKKTLFIFALVFCTALSAVNEIDEIFELVIGNDKVKLLAFLNDHPGLDLNAIHPVHQNTVFGFAEHLGFTLMFETLRNFDSGAGVGGLGVSPKQEEKEEKEEKQRDCPICLQELGDGPLVLAPCCLTRLHPNCRNGLLAGYEMQQDTLVDGRRVRTIDTYRNDHKCPTCRSAGDVRQFPIIPQVNFRHAHHEDQAKVSSQQRTSHRLTDLQTARALTLADAAQLDLDSYLVLLQIQCENAPLGEVIERLYADRIRETTPSRPVRKVVAIRPPVAVPAAPQLATPQVADYNRCRGVTVCVVLGVIAYLSFMGAFASF